MFKENNGRKISKISNNKHKSAIILDRICQTIKKVMCDGSSKKIV